MTRPALVRLCPNSPGPGAAPVPPWLARPLRGSAWPGALGALLAIGLLGLLNRWAGPAYGLGLLYLLPITAAAWWSGLAYALLLSLAGACAWHVVDATAGAEVPTTVSLLNGAIRLGTFAIASSLLHRLRLGILREQTFAQTDPLTGVLNVRAFYERLLQEIERARRAAVPLSLAYIDLDHFKTLNDEWGHRAGDEALVQLTSLIRSHIRRGDALGRVGGDEFCLLLPATDAAETLLLLTRLQVLVERALSARGWPITTSIGAATFREPARDPDALIQHVDALMYGAKKGGKNRVHHENVPAGAGAVPRPGRVERRATARLASSRTARVRLAGEAGGELGLAVVQNVSRTGIGLSLACEIAAPACLLIEPIGACGLAPLRAMVVRLDADGDAWYYGCELALPLGEEDLQRWLGDWPGDGAGAHPHAGGAGLSESSARGTR